MSQYIDFTIDMGELGEHTFNVEYDYSPGTPDVWYLSNGDPGYPGDPPDVVIRKVLFHGQPFTLFDIEDFLYGCDRFFDEVGERESEREAEAADHYYQELKDAAYI